MDLINESALAGMIELFCGESTVSDKVLSQAFKDVSQCSPLQSFLGTGEVLYHSWEVLL